MRSSLHVFWVRRRAFGYRYQVLTLSLTSQSAALGPSPRHPWCMVMMMKADDYDAEALRYAPAEEQYQVMERWFRARFEDPAQRTPHESSEGGYIWIWGRSV